MRTNSGVSINNITVKRGDTVIIQDATLHLAAKSIIGLIGPNGAGKSSLLASVMGFYPLDRGSIQYNGLHVVSNLAYPEELKRHLAFVPEQPIYYSDLTLNEHITWKLKLWALAGCSINETYVTDLVDRFLLSSHLDKFPHQCSKGTLQKLMVVLAFMLPAEIILIDEPFIGLDVMAIEELKALITERRTHGACIVVSTHVLDSAEKLCDDFVFLSHGKILAQGDLSSLRKEFNVSSLSDIFIRLLRQGDL